MGDYEETHSSLDTEAEREAAEIQRINASREVKLLLRGYDVPKKSRFSRSQREIMEEILAKSAGPSDSARFEEEDWYMMDSTEDYVKDKDKYSRFQRINEQIIEIENPRTTEEYLESMICPICNILRPRRREKREFIVCDNRQCFFKGGGHFDCLGFPRVPSEQWFCDLCKHIGECGQCRKSVGPNDVLASCDWCDVFGHAECIRPHSEPLNIARSEDWRCRDCVCTVCEGQDSIYYPLLQCDQCGFFNHSSCLINSFQEFHIDPQIAEICLECFLKNEIDRNISDDGDRMDTEGLHDTEEVAHIIGMDRDALPDSAAGMDRGAFLDRATGMDSGAFLDRATGMERSAHPDYGPRIALNDVSTDAFDTILSGPSYLSSHMQNVIALGALIRKNPLLGFALYQNIVHGISPFANDQEWQYMARIAAYLRPSMSEEEISKHRPAKKLGRVLDREFPIKIYKHVLTCEFKGITISANCVFRDLKEAVEQILVSPTNVRNVPLYKIGTDCQSQSKWGPRLVELAEEFRRRKKANSEDFLLALQFASDGTGTNFTQLHPITLTIFNMDRSARVLNMATSYVIVCMVPVAANLQFAYQGRRISQTQACKIAPDLNTSRALRSFLRRSVEVLLEEVSELEEGFEIVRGNSLVKYRCFLHSWVCDMEERRHLLNLSLSPHWPCTHCFGRPVPGCAPCSDPELWTFVETNASRTFERVKTLDSANISGEELVGREKWSFESCFGYKRKSSNPFSKRTIFLTVGASDYFLFDRLHVFDGVVDKLWNGFRKIYGKSLVRSSSELGNIACGVSTGFHFHKMEEALHDFQFVVLALLHHDELKSRNGLRQNARRSHFLLALHFLRIVTILKDDAPGLLLEDLQESVSVFATELESLQDDLSVIRAGIDLNTAKIHELIEHAWSQVSENGPASGFSSDVFEWMHSGTKRSMHAGSMRRDDQGITVLKRGYFHALTSDELAAVHDFEPEANRQLWAVPVFSLKSESKRYYDDLCRNIEFLLEQYEELQGDAGLHWCIARAKQVLIATGFQDDTPAYSSVDCSLVCRLRQCRIKSSMHISVICSTSRRDHRILAFGGSEGHMHEPSQNEVPCCRHHDRNCELHCSFHRLRQPDTLYGFPVLFFELDGPRALILRLTDRIVSDQDVIASYRVPKILKFEVMAVSVQRSIGQTRLICAYSL